MKTLFKATPILLMALGLLSTPVAAMSDVPDTANYGQQQMTYPGTLDYVEGTAHLDGQLLNDHELHNVSMQPGQVLTTQTGKVEIVLMPGVYLRVGDHSAVRMISPDIADTKVQVLRGEAGVEVDELHAENDLQIVDGKFTTHLVEKGFYEFTANPPRVRAFSGEAEVAALGRG